MVRSNMADIFARRFAATNGGAKELYDVKRHMQQRGAYSPPGSVACFVHSLRCGPYTSVGSYPLFWLTSDGEALSFEACKANAGRIARSIRDGSNDGWRVVAYDVNYDDASMRCADTGERIESAYAEDDS